MELEASGDRQLDAVVVGPNRDFSPLWPRVLAGVCAAAVLALGATGLAGWLSGDSQLSAFNRAYYPIAPAAAFSLVLCGLALSLLLRPGRLSWRIIRGCALLVAVLAALRLVELVAGVDLHASRLFMPHLGAGGKLMAVPTVFGLLDTSLVLLLLTGRGQRPLAFGLSLMLAVTGLAFVLGYAYGAPLLYGPTAIPVALPTALALFALGVGPALILGGRELADRQFEAAERDRLNLEVRSQRNLLNTVVTNAPVGLVLLDGRDLRVKVANPTQNLFLDEPYRSMDLTGVALQDFVPDAEASGVAGVYREVAATGESRIFEEFELPGFARGVTYWRWLAVPVARPEGEAEGYDVLSMSIEVTEQVLARRRVEEAAGLAHRQAAELLALLNAIPDAILVWGPEGELLRSNQAASDLLGIDESARGRPWAEIWERTQQRLPGGEPLPVDQSLRMRALRGEVVRSLHLLVHREDGEDAIVSASAASFPDPEGKTAGAVVSFSDITALVHAEQEVQRRVIEAEALNRELESFAYSVSHDLRAPLRAIDGFSQAILEDYSGKLDAVGETYLQRIRAGSQRMGQLIDDLLTLSRVSREPLRRVAVNLSQLAEEIAENLRAAEPERVVEFRIQPGMTASGDRQLLGVALTNLLNNAWKFTAGVAHAVIEFGTLEQEGEVVFYVRDNGAGFDMTYANKLFSPFQRLHSLEEFSGNGVGLATVMRVLNRHGGRAWAEGEVGHGATFYYTLPH
jgi:PAS domain S-box-containing protein